MILSNNPRTYIGIAIYHREGGSIHKKYMYRWAGPHTIHTSKLLLNLLNNNIKKLRRIYDLK